MIVPTSVQPDAQQAFREIDAFAQRWEGGRNVDLHGRRFVNAGAGVVSSDFVTLGQLEALVGVSVRTPATGGDRTPSVTEVYYGTHAQRLARGPGTVSVGALWYETDRAAFYQAQTVSGAAAWVVTICRPLRTSDAKTADLGLDDAGFTWFVQTEGVTYRWSGTAWNYYLGSFVETFANRPDPALADRGMLFIASDRGEHVWRKGATAWELLEGVGGPIRNILANISGSLGADDVGYLFFATDFDRLYRWDGSAWQDAPGQPSRGQIAYFTSGLTPGTGWALCDGSTVTRSTATGGSTSIVLPDLVTDTRFIRSVAGTTGGTGGAATLHTHPVNPPDTTSGNDSASQVVQSGTGVAVAAEPHTHNTDIAEFTSGTPSGTAGDDALPPYLNLRPYMRL